MAIPENTVAPAVTGTAEIGEVLTTNTGTWDNVPVSYAYQWLRGGVAISGATASTYTVQRADIGFQLASRVTATNADGSASADSTATAAVPGTLIVEDGTGLPNAESYISAADADTYFALRSVAAWAALTGEQKEAALRKATDYMEQAYSELWKGERTTTTQALSWPRRCVEIRTDEWLAINIVPAAVSRACAEMALRASSADLSPDLGAQVQSETVGPISTTYATGARQQTKYQAIDGMLSSLIGGSQNTIKLVRG